MYVKPVGKRLYWVMIASFVVHRTRRSGVSKSPSDWTVRVVRRAGDVMLGTRNVSRVLGKTPATRSPDNSPYLIWVDHLHPRSRAV
jgi:hypothetical protein